MQMVMVSNNTAISAGASVEILRVEGDSMDVMNRVRDLVHTGYKILSHPLGASIKMLHSPVTSVLLEKGDGPIDPSSLSLIESDILKLGTVMGERPFDHRNREAYELIDRNRMQSALNELHFYGKGEDIATRA